MHGLAQTNGGRDSCARVFTGMRALAKKAGVAERKTLHGTTRGYHYYQYSYWSTEKTVHYDIIKQMHFLVTGGYSC
jgi:hypothetical protein